MGTVRTGLEVFLDRTSGRAGLPSGAKVGLIVHPASVDRDLRHTVDLFREAAGIRPVRLFAPEHGVRGEAQDMEQVHETLDVDSGLPVISLYGSNLESLRPDIESFQGLDAVVYDLQDVGTRYYTYITTLSFVMETAREAGLPVIVLARPTPIGGIVLEGPVLGAVHGFLRRPLPGAGSPWNDQRRTSCDV